MKHGTQSVPGEGALVDSDDLPARLRAFGDGPQYATGPWPLLVEAADEIERLRKELKETDDELGVSMEAEAKMGEALAACPACKLAAVAQRVVASHEDSNGVVTVNRAALLEQAEVLRQLAERNQKRSQ